MSFKLFEKLKYYLKYILFGDDLKSTVLFILLLFVIYSIIHFTNPYLFSIVLTPSMEHKNFYIEKYFDYNITERDIANWPFKNGINPGDMVIVWPIRSISDLKEGDVVLYIGVDGKPIVHRVIKIYNESCIVIMGDNNPYPLYYQHENCMDFSRIYGKVVFRIPYIGYPKLILSKYL